MTRISRPTWPAHRSLDRFNRTLHAEQDTRHAILRELIGDLGEGVEIRPPFRCEYGTRVSIGSRTFINFDCLMLDVAPITIGRRASSQHASSF